jgi:hypothetical protein
MNMDLYIFTSMLRKNIKIGCEAQRWAVSCLIDSRRTMRRRWSIAQYMAPGSRGVIYCSENGRFTMPFMTRTIPTCSRDTSTWPGETWAYPFEIVPLGSWARSVDADSAREEWEFLRGKNLSSIPGINQTNCFVPVKIEVIDWRMICSRLADHPDDAPFVERLTLYDSIA